MIERQQGAVADRYGVRFRVDAYRRARSRQAAIPAGRRYSPDRPAARTGQRSRRRRGRRGGRGGGHGADPDRRLRRRQAGRHREQGPARVEARRARRPRAAHGDAALCEAAAAAALPIIRHLSHRADEVDSLAGIVNGTCNFMITRIEQDELSLDEADRRGAGARLRRGRSVRRPRRARRRREALDPGVPRVRRVGASRRLPGARHPRAVSRPTATSPRRWAAASASSPMPPASTARSTWPSSRCCCRRGTCSRRSKRSTTPSTCAARPRATSGCSARAPARCPRPRRCSATSSISRRTTRCGGPCRRHCRWPARPEPRLRRSAATTCASPARAASGPGAPRAEPRAPRRAGRAEPRGARRGRAWCICGFMLVVQRR